MNKYDTVVIGSGLGGLTAALCHAQAGEKVIVIEQHYVPGGWSHSFTMDGNLFNTGVHYIGELSKGGLLRNIFEGLGLGGDLTFCEMTRVGYDHFFIDGKRYDFPIGRDQLKEYLIKQFPHEKNGIDSLLNKSGKLGSEVPALLDVASLADTLKLPFMAPSTVRWMLFSYDKFVRRYIRDERLVQLMSAHAGDHAMPPSDVMAPMHAGMLEHFMRGSFYPQGGSYKIPRSFVRAIKAHGGELLLKTKVDKILTEGCGRARKVVGVKLGNGSEISCSKVVSNADPHQTFANMLGFDTLSKGLRRRLSKTRYSPSCLAIFLAVDIDLKARGFDSGNYWYFNNSNMEDTFKICRDEQLYNVDDPPFFVLTVTTLKDPSKKNRYHNLEAFTYVPYSLFEKWRDSTSGNRSDEYLAFKERLKNRFLDNIENLIPDIRQHIKFCEMGTPLTNAFYGNSTNGNIFGTEKSILQTGPFAFPLKTEIRNLYMCGASTLGHGVIGALASGLSVSRISLDCKMSDLLRYKDKEITVYQSEDIETWPNRFHKTIREKWRTCPEPSQEVERPLVVNP